MRKINFYAFLTVILLLLPAVTIAQPPGNSVVFDGDDDYINVSTTSRDELNPEENLTVESWVYLDSAAAAAHQPFFVARLNSYSLTLNASGNILMYLRDDEGVWHLISGYSTIYPGRWYHLACTYDGSVARVYVNGVHEGSETINDTIAASTANYRLGARNNVGNQTNLEGRMDETRVWNVTRTQTEIRDNMNRTIPGSTAGLVAYWRFDEGSGTNADCETSYDNDGTLTNMDPATRWATSTAPLGHASIFNESADIWETTECAVDVDFYPTDPPGSGRSLAVMQVNQLPNTTSGLYPDRASLYWEIWSEDIDFDGNYSADVRFHYDDISGLPVETALELFRRDEATDTWTAVSGGFNIVSNDGGSSTTSDGIGYIEYYLTELIAGGFNGQYMISWSNEPPVVSDIPDQSVAEGTAFAQINLDDYVDDPDNADSEISWSASGQTDVTVDITNRVATITVNDENWNGSNTVTFTAEDPEGATDSDQVTFEVTPVNDPPVVADIPDQEVAEGTAFATITLDNYVTDVDNDITTLTWTSSGASNLSVDITGRVATITPVDAEWNGSETITFQAADPDGATDTDDVMFTVTPVNDPPVIDGLQGQSILEGESFTPIMLDDYVVDADDHDSTLTWSTSGDSYVTVSIVDRVATITPNDPDWYGADWVIFIVSDPEGAEDRDTIRFYVGPVNDAPVVAIPDQETAEGTAFAALNLDDYVSDVDDHDSTLTWTVGGNVNLSVTITGRVATVTALDPDWNGSELLIFTATDTSGAMGADTTGFTVTAVNDAPTVNAAIPDTVALAGAPFEFVLAGNTFEDVDEGDVLTLSATWSMGGSTPAWLSFDPATGTFSGTPDEADVGIVEVTVTATDAGSASVADIFEIEVKSTVGIGHVWDGLEISLYPNPNTGSFVIESDQLEAKDVVLEIFNEKGQLVWNREIRDQVGTLRESVDLDNAADGLYILRVRNESGMINKRFVIGK